MDHSKMYKKYKLKRLQKLGGATDHSAELASPVFVYSVFSLAGFSRYIVFESWKHLVKYCSSVAYNLDSVCFHSARNTPCDWSQFWEQKIDFRGKKKRI